MDDRTEEGESHLPLFLAGEFSPVARRSVLGFICKTVRGRSELSKLVPRQRPATGEAPESKLDTLTKMPSQSWFLVAFC